MDIPVHKQTAVRFKIELVLTEKLEQGNEFIFGAQAVISDTHSVVSRSP